MMLIFLITVVYSLTVQKIENGVNLYLSADGSFVREQGSAVDVIPIPISEDTDDRVVLITRDNKALQLSRAGDLFVKLKNNTKEKGLINTATKLEVGKKDIDRLAIQLINIGPTYKIKRGHAACFSSNKRKRKSIGDCENEEEEYILSEAVKSTKINQPEKIISVSIAEDIAVNAPNPVVNSNSNNNNKNGNGNAVAQGTANDVVHPIINPDNKIVLVEKNKNGKYVAVEQETASDGVIMRPLTDREMELMKKLSKKEDNFRTTEVHPDSDDSNEATEEFEGKEPESKESSGTLTEYPLKLEDKDKEKDTLTSLIEMLEQKTKNKQNPRKRKRNGYNKTFHKVQRRSSHQNVQNGYNYANPQQGNNYAQPPAVNSQPPATNAPSYVQQPGQQVAQQYSQQQLPSAPVSPQPAANAPSFFQQPPTANTSPYSPASPQIAPVYQQPVTSALAQQPPAFAADSSNMGIYTQSNQQPQIAQNPNYLQQPQINQQFPQTYGSPYNFSFGSPYNIGIQSQPMPNQGGQSYDPMMNQTPGMYPQRTADENWRFDPQLIANFLNLLKAQSANAPAA